MSFLESASGEKKLEDENLASKMIYFLSSLSVLLSFSKNQFMRIC